jgi:hypothetical protein
MENFQKYFTILNARNELCKNIYKIFNPILYLISKNITLNGIFK